MKYFFTCCLLLLALLAPAQPPTAKYQVLTGKVAGLNATLHLAIAGNKATGYIWFSGSPMPLFCYSVYNAANDSLVVNANANPMSVTLTGIIKNNIFSGTSAIEKDNSNGKEAPFSLQPSADTVFTPFAVDWQQATLKMPARLKNESTGEYYGSAIWPATATGKKIDTTLKYAINKLLGNKSGLKPAAALLTSAKIKFASGWNNYNAKLKPSDAKEMGLSLSQALEQQAGVMYEDNRVLTLYGFNYAFTGGAHGNYVTSITNIDKRTGAAIKLSDVLTADGIKALPKILSEVLVTQYNLDKTKSLEENGLFVKTLEPSANFYIANGNLGFVYSLYSIMAYAYGEPNLFVPAAAVARYIKPAYKQVL